MLKDDYVMRLNNEAVRTVMKLIFNIDESQYEDSLYADQLHYQKFQNLIALASRGKINEAENMLYENIDVADIKDLQTALLFYDHLNSMDDLLLESYNFSYEEILDGVKEVIRMYGYEGLAEAFKI